jgi:hypothetical protein
VYHGKIIIFCKFSFGRGKDNLGRERKIYLIKVSIPDKLIPQHPEEGLLLETGKKVPLWGDSGGRKRVNTNGVKTGGDSKMKKIYERH